MLKIKSSLQKLKLMVFLAIPGFIASIPWFVWKASNPIYGLVLIICSVFLYLFVLILEILAFWVWIEKHGDKS